MQSEKSAATDAGLLAANRPRPIVASAGWLGAPICRPGGDSRLWGVLAVALAIRLVLLWGMAGVGLRVSDEYDYAELARSIRTGDGFAWARADATPMRPAGRATSLRPPAYPAFVAAVWTLAGRESTQAVRAAQAAIGLVLVVLVHRLGRHLFDERAGLVAAMFVAVYPSLLFATVLLLTELLFACLLVAVALAYVWTTRARSRAAALALGALVGVAALTRSVLWPFPLVLVPLVAWYVGGPARRWLAYAGLVMLGYLAVVGPWAVRNTRLQGTFTVVDTMGGLNLYAGNYAYTPEDRMWDAFSLQGERFWRYELDRQYADQTGWTEGRQERWARDAALAYMRDHPVVTIRRSLLKFADFWGLERELIAALQRRAYTPPRWLAALCIATVAVSYPLLLLLGVAGAALAPPGDRGTHALLLAVVLFVCGVHSIVFGHSRYHLPLVPIIAIYAGRACTGVRWRMLRAGPRPAAAAVLMLVLVVIWGREVLVRDADRIALLLEALR
jgi:4-amino-4-deoxy-L-arabinose transferase-like glycosyltransferase